MNDLRSVQFDVRDRHGEVVSIISGIYINFRFTYSTNRFYYVCSYFFYLFSLILHYPTMLSNESIKRISIAIIINQSIILELFNSCTSLNALFNCIPSSVSDGMSISDTIINHHSPISLSLYNRNAIHLL